MSLLYILDVDEHIIISVIKCASITLVCAVHNEIECVICFSFNSSSVVPNEHFVSH